MTRVLLTAFEPYHEFRENASWLALIELTRQLPTSPEVTTRLYPVDFTALRSRLEADLAGGYDMVLHLGQSPGAARIALETIGLNVARLPDGTHASLIEDGPLAYQSQLPLGKWAEHLCALGIPTAVSHHAGTFLCNAALYLSHYFIEKGGLPTQAAFVHVPLAPQQVVDERGEKASMPSAMVAAAVRIMLENVAARELA